MGMIVCPYCQREIEAPEITIDDLVVDTKRLVAGLVPTWLQEFEKEAGYKGKKLDNG